MKRFALCSLFISVALITNAQDFRLLGTQLGAVGGGFTSMLLNRDDIDADGRLDPQVMNFSYCAGIERLNWQNQNFGIGVQALYWKAGAAYKGFDTLSKYSLTAKTDLTYAKMPVLFYYRSYNRYKPDRRFRINTFFGPYVAFLIGYKESVNQYNEENKVSIDYNTSGFNVTSLAKVNGVETAPATNTTLDGFLYKLYDAGFVAGFGGEVRVWKNTVIALNLRTDIGNVNIENNKQLTQKFSNGTETKFNPWKDLYYKYHAKLPGDNISEFNRPATRNYSVGAFLTIRKFFTKKEEKELIML